MSDLAEVVSGTNIVASRAAIQAAMDEGYLHADLRADSLVAQAYEGFHRAALLWARGELDASNLERKLARKGSRRPRRRVARAG